MREAVMACNIVYVDRTAREDKLVKREDARSTESSIETPNHAADPRSTGAANSNLQTLLGTFSEGSQLQLVQQPPADNLQSTSVPRANHAYRSCPN